ncbi:hypothetical protein [Mucilaginibacter phyllosphaerae]|uniref:Uncharacterized protein n=1 Tax=Mucilaginibacter phyllosphaerae TaxID=1812349 RepID=A0A4Y8AD76_9SPHI|nr:hypothetical protein [Mucilaginibacter phyllosphaerae]MBB3969321.1 hypothetical protein [Mucilaginibacter phyllosphaerae]TEW65886.1 hypothetical protein E2R65_12180 [Mucilaginibacter phyllosphaerae]
MLTTNHNDILFDDLATISSIYLSGSPAENSMIYGDCGNRFETEPPVDDILDRIDNQLFS